MATVAVLSILISSLIGSLQGAPVKSGTARWQTPCAGSRLSDHDPATSELATTTSAPSAHLQAVARRAAQTKVKVQQVMDLYVSISLKSIALVSFRLCDIAFTR